MVLYLEHSSNFIRASHFLVELCLLVADSEVVGGALA